jgi:hypothetical protein
MATGKTRKIESAFVTVGEECRVQHRDEFRERK